MGTTATIIALFYLGLVVIGIIVSVIVWRSTHRKREIDRERLERNERLWMAAVVVLLVALLLPTVLFIPYGASAGPDAQVVNVVGKQYAWEIDQTEIKAKQEVEFVLTSPDVNHGFGVYDEDDVLLFQAQVIPGEVQTVVWTFDEPGRYEVLCLEFCGVAHHLMINQFEVVP